MTRFHLQLLALGLLPISLASAQETDATLSEASKRAIRRGYAEIGPDFYVQFKQKPLRGDFAPDPEVTRRDPSAVIQEGGFYHVWYTRGTGETVGYGSGDPNAKVYPWDLTEVWYATSEDGWTWKEHGVAVGRGPAGAYDDRAVFTPEILRYDGKYYLVYQVVKAPYRSRTKNQVGMAVADRVAGPWRKLPEPILSATDDGAWEGEIDDRRYFSERGSFDSYKVHDPTLLHYQGKFWLYYKGQRIGEQLTFSGREINHGVAVAENIEGPYIKSEYNPISNSGHELAVWHYRGGIASLLTTDGPERNTIQWAPDGINFFIKARLSKPPVALGIFRPENPSENDTLPAGLQWGLAHQLRGNNDNSIVRYSVHRRVLRDPATRDRKK